MLSRRFYPLVFRGALIFVIVALALRVAGLTVAKAFGMAGFLAFIVAVVMAGIATSEPD